MKVNGSNGNKLNYEAENRCNKEGKASEVEETHRYRNPEREIVEE